MTPRPPTGIRRWAGTPFHRPPRMPERRTWIVTTDGERPLDDVVRELASAGLAVEQVLDAIGLITGTADGSALAALRAVRGVADVSPDEAIDVGPPDAPHVW